MKNIRYKTEIIRDLHAIFHYYLSPNVGMEVFMKMKGLKTRILVLLLIVAVLFYQAGLTMVFAADDVIHDNSSAASPKSYVITQFKELGEAVLSQNVVTGTQQDDLALPKSLAVSAYDSEDKDMSAIEINAEGIGWISTPDYEPQTAGEYLFTPLLPEGWSLAEGVSPSAISVKMESKNSQVKAMAGMSLMATSSTCGDFNVVGDSSKYSYDSATKMLTVTGDVTIGMVITNATTTGKIVVNGGTTAVPVNIILQGVSIDVSATEEACAFEVQGNSAVNLSLVGTNKLISGLHKAGLQVQNKDSNMATLVVLGSGTLTATGGGARPGDGGGAGIGGSGGVYNNIIRAGGTITIKGSVTVTANGGGVIEIGDDNVTGGAGIGAGGGLNSPASNITMSENAKVIATGADMSAGIGGSWCGAGGIITINGSANVTATGGDWGGAGIGGGSGGEGGTINISQNAIIKATGGGSDYKNSGGAGIGGGGVAAGGTITISGGTVNATGTDGGAGIGGGGCTIFCNEGEGGAGGIITISGGIVNAVASKAASGIGGGEKGIGATIKIGSGVTLKSVSDGTKPAIHDSNSIIEAPVSSTIATVFMANFTNPQAAGTKTEIRDGSGNVLSTAIEWTPTSNLVNIGYKSIAMTLPSGDYTVFTGGNKQQQGVSPNISGDFATISNKLNIFSSVTTYIPTYAVTFLTNGVQANGVTATASAVNNQKASNTVNITVTMSGTATAAGTHTIGLNSAKAGTITPPTTVTKSVSMGQNPTDIFTFTFTMPAEAVEDLVVSNTFNTVGGIKIDQNQLVLTGASNATYGAGDQTLSTTGGSGTGGVSYTVVSGQATISGSKLTLTGAGDVVIKATKAGDDNYNEAVSANVTIKVDPKPLTVYGVVVSNKIYNGTTNATPTAEGTLSGVINSDDVTLTQGTAVFESTNVADGIKVNFSGYGLGGTKAANYALFQPSSVIANITLATASVTGLTIGTAVSGTVVTNGTLATVTVEGVNGETFTGTWSYTVPTTNAGSAAATFTKTGGTAVASNYNAILANLNFTEVTNTIAVQTGTATANGVKATASVESSKKVGDIVSVTVTLSGTATVAGTHTIGLTSAKAGTITPPVIVTKSVSMGQNPTDIFTFTFTMPAEAVEDLVVSNTFNTVGGIKIDQSLLVLTGASNATYGAGDQTLSTTGGSGTGGVSYTVVSGQATITGSKLTLTGAGDVVIKATKAGDDNYNEAVSANITIKVDPKPLTVSGVVVSNKIYNGTTNATPTAAGTLSGVINSDDVILTQGTAVFESANVADGIKVNFSGYGLGGTKAANYTLSQPSSVIANITLATASVIGLTIGTAVAGKEVTNGTLETVIVEGVNVETFTGTWSYTVPIANGGTAAATFTKTGGTAVVSNYKKITANLTFTEVTNTIAVQTGTASANGVTATVSVENSKKVGDIVSVTVTLSGTATAAGTHTIGLTSAKAGITPPATVSKSVSIGQKPTDVFSFTFTMPAVEVNDLVVTNTFSTAGGTKINQNTLVLTGASNTIYGAVDQTLSGTGGSGTGEFSYTVVSGSAIVLGSKLTLTGAGTVVINATKAGDDNYNEAISADVTIKVDPKPLTVSGIAASNKTYDGTTNATPTGIGILNGIINLDDVTLTQGTAIFESANVADGIKVNFSGYGLGGTKAANYTLSQPSSVIANITLATASVTGLTIGTAVAGNVVINGTLETVIVEGVNGETFTGTWSYTVPTTNSGTAAATFTKTGGTAGASNYKEIIANLTFTEVTNTISVQTGMATANGVAATVSVENSKRVGDSISVTVTLSGAATAAGIHTIGITSSKVGITPPATVSKSVSIGQNPTDIFTFTFTMPAVEVNDLVVTNTFLLQAVTNVNISPKTTTLTLAGATQQLKATLVGVGGVEETVTWLSSNTAVATVSNTGLVTAVVNGTATITATSTVDNSKADTATINVVIPVPSSNSGSGYTPATKTDLIRYTDSSSNDVKITAAELKNVKTLTIKGKGADLVFGEDVLVGMNLKSSLEVIIKSVKAEELSEAARAIVGTRPVFSIKVLIDGQTVTNTGKLRIEVTYTPQTSENISKLGIFYIADDGNITQMVDCHYDINKKVMVFTTTHLSLYAVGLITDKSVRNFTDVAKGYWAETSIYYLADKGIVHGKTETIFAPADNITRAEFVTILAKMSGNILPLSTNEFSDVSTNAWYAPYVAWAAQTGVTMGFDGQFHPNDLISRQDMIVMLKNYVDKVSKSTMPKINKIIVFADDEAISSYARSSVSTMQQAGIISGKGGNIFDPKASATRAEAARMIAMLLQAMGK